MVIGLRSDVEAEFSRQFQDLLSQINRVTHSAEQSLLEKIDFAADALDMHIEYPHLPALKCSPSLAALGEPIATELGGPAYAASSWPKLSSSEHNHQLLSLIKAEFDAIAEKLAQSAQEELERTTSFILDHFRSNVSHPLKLIIEQRRMLIAECCSNGDASDVEMGERRRESLENQLKQMESDASAYDSVSAALASIKIGEKE